MGIDRNGNIILDRASDLFIPLARNSLEGDPIDLTGALLKFVAKGAFTIVPASDPTNSLQRRLHFTPAHAQSLSKPTPFVLQFTRSDGSREVIWQGIISATGFATDDSSNSTPTTPVPPVTTGTYTIANTPGSSTLPANQVDGAVAALTKLNATYAGLAAKLAQAGF